MTETSLLLVEGQDDACVLCELFERHGIPETFQVEERGGLDKLLQGLPVELKRSNLARLGIVVDANADLEARWARLSAILQQGGGVQVPGHPDSRGTIVQVERPERMLPVGVWLMPDNSAPGMLEHFVSLLIPQDDRLWPRAQQSVDQIPEAERLFRTQHSIKAHVRTWLAWQEEPGIPMGTAIKAGWLQADSAQVRRFLAWIRRLFDL